MFPKKQLCVDCHFFVTKVNEHPESRTLDISTKCREQIREGEFSGVPDYKSLVCDFGVWDSGYNWNESKRIEILTGTDRRDYCFFWKHRPGMLLRAARTLQERESREADRKRDLRLAKVSIAIAALALFISATSAIAQWVKGQPPG